METLRSQILVIIVNMTERNLVSSRDRTRAQLAEVAAKLLATEGPDAVTTRSVALAGGQPPPRSTGCSVTRTGCSQAVAEHGFTSYMAGKHPIKAGDDPVEPAGRMEGFHVGFGLANPELFRLMHTVLGTPRGQAAAATRRGRTAGPGAPGGPGRTAARDRAPAVELIRAAGTGVVFTLIDQPEDERDDGLAATAWESVCAAILVDENTDLVTAGSPAAAAVTLRAGLSDVTALSATERALLGDWLDRIASS